MISRTNFDAYQTPVVTPVEPGTWSPMGRRLACLMCAVFVGGPFAFAQDAAALQRQVAELVEGQKAMQKELQEIKELLKSAPRTGRAANLPSTMDATGILVKGDAKAPVTIVEYTDMQCPFCSRHAQNTFSQIMNEYVESGKVRYVVKDFPLESMHPNAFKAAEANHCAAEQNRAWDMHDRLFANQKKLSNDDLVGYADAMDLDSAKFKACLESGKYASVVRKEMSEAQSSGVTGTPTFFLGASDAKSMKPEKMLTGAVAFSAFKAAIDDLLAKK